MGLLVSGLIRRAKIRLDEGQGRSLSKTYHGQISRRVTTQGSQTINKGLTVAKHLRRLHPR